MNDRNAREKLLHSIKSNLVLFTGAGLSVSYPSCLPMGRQIIDRIFGLIIFHSKIRVNKKIIKWMLGIKKEIPMELVWEILMRVLGSEVLEALLILDGKKPNKDHVAISLLSSKYNLKTILTLNFDGLQEEAISRFTNKKVKSVFQPKDFKEYQEKSTTSQNTIWVIHLHNLISPENLENLATTVSSVGTGLPRYKALQLAKILRENDLLCAGYSNGDTDTFPLIDKSKNRLFWYLYDDDLPQSVQQRKKKNPTETYVIKRHKNEAGFWEVITKIDEDIGKQIQFLESFGKFAESDLDVNERLAQIEKTIEEKLGKNETEKIKTSRLFISILCDELGKRGFAQKIENENRKCIDGRPLVNYSELMFVGHLYERLGDIKIAESMYLKAKKFALSEDAQQESQIEYVSAELGLWKRNPLKIICLLNWFISIKKLSQSHNIKIKQRAFWELGDFYNHLAEYFFFPSTWVIRKRNGKLSSNDRKILSRADHFVLKIINKSRNKMFKISASFYTRVLRLAMWDYVDELPSYTSLACIRLVEVLAGSKNFKQAKYSLYLLERGERYYKWVKSEHGNANAICARAVFEFYTRNKESFNMFYKAKKEYGSHYSGILKTQIFIYRIKEWKFI